MSEGELQKELKKLKTVLPMEYASKDAVLELMDEAKDDFPYKIYFDNNMDGKGSGNSMGDGKGC